MEMKTRRNITVCCILIDVIDLMIIIKSALELYSHYNRDALYYLLVPTDISISKIVLSIVGIIVSCVVLRRNIRLCHFLLIELIIHFIILLVAVPTYFWYTPVNHDAPTPYKFSYTQMTITSFITRTRPPGNTLPSARARLTLLRRYIRSSPARTPDGTLFGFGWMYMTRPMSNNSASLMSGVSSISSNRRWNKDIPGP